ncbi:hypothetical protein OSJ57_15535 [Sphingomonas sp. HH69]
MSESVLKLVALTQTTSLEPETGDWTKASVFWFDGLMSHSVRVAGEADRALDYFSSDGTPHDPPGEGFIDRDAQSAISFLLDLKD